MKPTLLVLAAGMGSRYGGVKQIAAVGIHDETLLDYAVYDAVTNGFGKVVFIIRKDIKADFRERFFNRIARNCNAEYVFQSLDSLLTEEQLSRAVNRKKPWGTAHAVLCAKEKINEPFAVINADDYYGRAAYKTIATHLSTLTNDSAEHAMVGYILEKTLSRSGSVSRGVCVVGNGYLSGISENKNIFYKKEGSAEKIISEIDEEEIELSGRETVSMNLFGFTPKIFDFFDGYFADFIHKYAESEKAECLLPEAAGLMIKKGLGRIKVYTTTERWFGMTYPEDREIVRKELAGKIKEKYYPEFLWR
ncbi:nucleotidyltransferase family protein [Treponema pedis]|uniref:nucleotidyltransferase family protein n=1 Tax=Treponema pedis TaxID=409322 RepID=UPI00040F0CFF|nr:sugar phosphate nucleotidyltransferase [Treponema pedis]